VVGRGQGRTEVLIIVRVAYGRQFAGDDGKIPSNNKKVKVLERLVKGVEAGFLSKSAYLAGF
jgi:hypothetical protein